MNRKSLLAALVTLTLWFGAGAPAHAQSTTDETQVREIAARWEKAWNNHDMKSLAALFTDDADFVNVGARRFRPAASASERGLDWCSEQREPATGLPAVQQPHWRRHARRRPAERAPVQLLSPEQRVPADHPLRAIRQMTDDALRQLSPQFEAIYAKSGRPSVPPAQLLRARSVDLAE